MTTVDHRKSAHPPGWSSTGSTYDDDSSESLGSSIPEFLNLQVILPDGSVKTVEVHSGKQMLDLTIQLTKLYHLSPADHTIALYHPKTNRPMDYKASQMIGALHVETIHLISKKASKNKSKQNTVAQPFEITQRLSVNLPRNQKTVIRINPHSTLADIFKMICKEQGMDPYKHELRHPTDANTALNMAGKLSFYNINEITVVNIADASVGLTSLNKQSIYDSHWTHNNSMPRKKESQAPPSEEASESYMPGMTEKKKRRSILDIFSRKDKGKFTLSEASYTSDPVHHAPPVYEQKATVSNGSRRSKEIRPQDLIQATSTTSLQSHKQISSTTSLQSLREIPSSSSIQSHTTSTTSLQMVPPEKSHRKKRQAPAPPVVKPLSVDTTAVPSTSTQQAHSRGSSHSSGFDESSVSPLESPGSTTERPKNNIPTTSLDRSGHLSNGDVITEDVHVITTSANSTVSRASSLSTGASGSMCSLPRTKKKRPAPPPPGAVKLNCTPPESTVSTASSPTIKAASLTRIPDVPTSPSKSENEETFDTRELQMAIAAELKKEVSYDGYMSEPHQSPIREDIIILNQREHLPELERQKSDVAVFVDQMKELTENVRLESESETDIPEEHIKTQAEFSTIQFSAAADEKIKIPDLTVNEEIRKEKNPPEDIGVSLDAVGQEMKQYSPRNISYIEVEDNLPNLDLPKLNIADDLEESGMDVGVVGHKSDSSSGSSISGYDLNEEIDSDTEVLPDSSEPVLVKKKILPAFSLDLEKELIEDKMEGEDMKIEYMEKDEDIEFFEEGEYTTIIKVDDYMAAVNAFDTIEEEPANHEEEAHIDIPIKLPQFQNNRKDSWADCWSESPIGGKQMAIAHVPDAEISLDNLDVMYVSPHDNATEHIDNDEDNDGFKNDINKAMNTTVISNDDGTVVEYSNHSADIIVDEAHKVVLSDEQKVTPSSRRSLLSLIAGVKSSKIENRIQISQPKTKQAKEYYEITETVTDDHQEIEPKPIPEPTQKSKHEFKSLRDAFKAKPEEPERESFIIKKPEPYKLPPPELREQITTPIRSAYSIHSETIEESRYPAGTMKLEPEELNPQPIIYNTASLAVSRRAPRITASQEEKDEEEKPKFWGPRPWSARDPSETFPDVQQVLQKSREAVSMSRELPAPEDLTENQTISMFSTPQKEKSVVGVYSPGKNLSVNGSPKERMTEISFSPPGEEEEHDHPMEDKSITMIAYPVEKKSILKTALEADTRQYNSSMTLNNSGEFQSDETRDAGHYHSTQNLETIPHDENSNTEKIEHKPILKARGRSSEIIVDKEKTKKTLQQQYTDLQQQYERWQQQLMENQKLLAENKLLDKSPEIMKLPTSMPPPPPPIDLEEETFTVEETKSVRVNNYQRLSAPRPFGQWVSNPQAFKPRPIMKKHSSFESNPLPAGGFLSSDAYQSYSIDTKVNLPPSPEPVVHKTLTASKSDSHSLRKVVSPRRFEPKLDPREELMIAIRNAGGRKTLSRTVSAEANWQ